MEYLTTAKDTIYEYPMVFVIITCIVLICIIVYFYSGVKYLASGSKELLTDLEAKMNSLIKSIYSKQDITDD
jgi:uncharacterized membrane protein